MSACDRARLYVINSPPIKLRRQAADIHANSRRNRSKSAAFLAGDDSALDALLTEGVQRERLDRATRDAERRAGLVVVFGSEIRATTSRRSLKFGESAPGAKFVCLGDYANSRGAADMGLYPHLLPGYVPVGSDGKQAGEWLAAAPTQPGLALPDMMKAAQEGKIKALYIVGSNPVARYNVDPFTFRKAFTVVQDMFLTETAIVADVVLPVAAAYEKAGTYTNTCGDIQMNKKAGDMDGVKPDFEIIVRLAERMGYDVRKLVPFGPGVRADMGQSRGAQSGEADRHAVWLVEHDLEPKMSPVRSDGAAGRNSAAGARLRRVSRRNFSRVATNIRRRSRAAWGLSRTGQN